MTFLLQLYVVPVTVQVNFTLQFRLGQYLHFSVLQAFLMRLGMCLTSVSEIVLLCELFVIKLFFQFLFHVIVWEREDPGWWPGGSCLSSSLGFPGG